MWRSSFLIVIACSPPVRADDWRTFGRDWTHNAVTYEKGAPLNWQIEVPTDRGTSVIHSRNIKWSARLGSVGAVLGAPVIANGLVWVGTNNDFPRDPTRQKDASVLMCFRESDGKFLWQYVSPRLGNFDQDSPRQSMGSTPLVEGDWLWLITNRCEMLCLDTCPLRRGVGPPRQVWKVDMRKEFGVVPICDEMLVGFMPSPAGDAERVYAVSGNGALEPDGKILAPNAPSLICFAKRTGRVLWMDSSPGNNILHLQRSSPLVINIRGRTQVVVGQGDGWLRSFEAQSGKLIWKCDLNPKGAKYSVSGQGRRNYVMATPVYYEDRIYIAPGQDWAHGAGSGDNELYCIDPTGEGDVSAELEIGPRKARPNPNSRAVWRFGRSGNPDMKNAEPKYVFGRVLANCTIADGLVYVGDHSGFLFCLDAMTGQLQWSHDLEDGLWSAPLWADGRIYAASDDIVWIFAHGRQKKILNRVRMNRRIGVTPVYANGTLYIKTTDLLYAIRGDR